MEEEENQDNEENEEKSERAASSSSYASLPIAQRFHHDGLHSIFRFLRMRELNHAARSCRPWFAAAVNPSFHLPSLVPVYATLEKLRALIASPLRNHINKLTLIESVTSIAQFTSLQCHALQSLTKFGVSIDLSSVKRTPRQAIMLPARLKKLTIWVDGVTNYALNPSDAVVRGVQQLLINAATRVSTLTHLKLYLSVRDVKLDDTCLINLVNLEYLSLESSRAVVEAAMSTVKRLPMLRSLYIFTKDDSHHDHTSILHSLCSAPTPAKLESLVIN